MKNLVLGLATMLMLLVCPGCGEETVVSDPMARQLPPPHAQAETIERVVLAINRPIDAMADTDLVKEFKLLAQRFKDWLKVGKRLSSSRPLNSGEQDFLTRLTRAYNEREMALWVEVRRRSDVDPEKWTRLLAQDQGRDTNK